jgi:hypothetical protein
VAVSNHLGTATDFLLLSILECNVVIPLIKLEVCLSYFLSRFSRVYYIHSNISISTSYLYYLIYITLILV